MICDWVRLAFRRDDDRPSRVWHRGVSEDDDGTSFIDMPAPVLAHVAGPLGVTFQCADGGVYHLSSDAGAQDVSEWRVQLLAFV